LGTFSFHETKNFICGEGGALCINSEALVERAEILRDKGTNRQKFFRGQVDKYTWVDLGSSNVPSEICAAFLFAQLELMDEITERRRHLYENYRLGFEELEVRGRLRLPRIPSECQSNYHMFYLLMNSLEDRTSVIDHLKGQGIQSVFHYVPLHSSPMAKSLGCAVRELPVTEGCSSRLVRLPFFYELNSVDQQRVIDSVRDWAKTI
jgi:dTDP-4-amino-4,6-dideoxygalactose transaminase